MAAFIHSVIADALSSSSFEISEAHAQTNVPHFFLKLNNRLFNSLPLVQVIKVMGGFTGAGGGCVRGVNQPPRISLTPLIKCSTHSKFRFTPTILCESL